MGLETMGVRARGNPNQRKPWGQLCWALVFVVYAATTGGAMASPPMQLAKGIAKGAEGMAQTEAYLRQSSTFQHDGIEETLRLEAVRPLTGCAECSEYTWYFESLFPGYGDRRSLTMTPKRTPHRARIVLAGEVVVSGVLDQAWDMARQMILDVE